MLFYDLNVVPHTQHIINVVNASSDERVCTTRVVHLR